MITKREVALLSLTEYLSLDFFGLMTDITRFSENFTTIFNKKKEMTSLLCPKDAHGVDAINLEMMPHQY